MIQLLIMIKTHKFPSLLTYGLLLLPDGSFFFLTDFSVVDKAVVVVPAGVVDFLKLVMYNNRSRSFFFLLPYRLKLGFLTYPLVVVSYTNSRVVVVDVSGLLLASEMEFRVNGYCLVLSVVEGTSRYGLVLVWYGLGLVWYGLVLFSMVLVYLTGEELKRKLMS